MKRILILYACMTAACSYGPARLTPQEKTLMTIHSVFTGVAQYRDSLGRLPVNPAEVCRLNAWWCHLDSARWLIDGWNRPVLYQPQGSSYGVRSIGPDGVLNTQDDLFLTSLREKELMREIAGCYALSTKLWHLPAQWLRLDTISSGAGKYRVEPAAGYQSAVWYPLPERQVWAEWSTPPTGVLLQFRVGRDSLVGTAHELSDFGRARHKDVFATRASCPSSASHTPVR